MESLHDGIPGRMEKAARLEQQRTASFTKSVAPDGYTVLEHYLDGIPMRAVREKNEKRP